MACFTRDTCTRQENINNTFLIETVTESLPILFAATTSAVVQFTAILPLALFIVEQSAASPPVVTRLRPVFGFLIGYNRLYCPLTPSLGDNKSSG